MGEQSFSKGQRLTELSLLYEVTSIPVNFLLDGDGIILSVGLRGRYLNEKLKELLK